MVTVKRIPGEGQKQLDFALKNLSGKVGKVGWFEKSRYDDKNRTPVAYVAAIHEYGYPPGNIPPRPFIRPTIMKQESIWRKVAETGSKQIIKGVATIDQVMQSIGLKASGDIKKTISRLITPPLSQKTIYARLHRKSNKKKVGLLTKPLIDTGVMLGTLTNIVENE